ncbi:MAG: ribonuclease Z [Candidatus Caldarchaeum sp.]|nr:ribonuclease Z [Candidatus Caldarchaeum sp.]MDW7977295.1 ribonuclease Z [Candidatus Caldarchaeum sp.]MDW8359859.1 ribonuclease Z [Candidatus Caldarchaeum sp.]
MKLCFLGTGGGMPSTNRGLPAVAVRLRKSLILFDCGEGTQRQLIRSGLGTKPNIHIFITHLHGDHVLGIPGLLFTLSMNGRTDVVNVHGPPSTARFLEAVMMPQLGKLGFEVKVNELTANTSVRVDNVTVSNFPTEHTSLSYGYVMQEDTRPGKMREDLLDSLGVPRGPLWGMLQRGKPIEFNNRVIKPEEARGPPRPGRKVVYTGDTRPCVNVVEAAVKADVLIHDSTFDDSLREKAVEEGHSTASEAAETAMRAGVKRLYLFHISPRYDDAALLLTQARRLFAESYVAEDLETYSVPFTQ